MGKAREIAYFGHKLRAEWGAYPLHGHDYLILWQLGGETVHFQAELFHCERYRIELLHSLLNQKLSHRVFREHGNQFFGKRINLCWFLWLEVIAVPFAPFLIALSKRSKPKRTHTVHVPEWGNKVYPFLAAIAAGRTVKEVINARVSLIQQGDEVVLVRGFLFHVEAELVIHGF